MSEFILIDWLRRELAAHSAGMALEAQSAWSLPWPKPSAQTLITPPGDDCAVLASGPSDLLYAADMLLEGVHFDLALASPELVGRKALAVNLSDIAAMAGRPEAVTVCLALPRHGGLALAQGLYRGMMPLAREFKVEICGGDTNAWDGPLVVSVAVTGRAHPSGSVLRSGARAGDWILVSGSLGGSLSGKHLNFTPRLREAWQLRSAYPLSAMLDLSDGLVSDLKHILAASGVGAHLDPALVPLSQEAKRLAALTPQRTALERALSDGEDFELCFTLAAAEAAQLLHAQPFAPAVVLHRVGTITSGGGLSSAAGPLAENGWVHAFS